MYQITETSSPADSAIVITLVLPEEYPTVIEALKVTKRMADSFTPYHPSYPVQRYTTSDPLGHGASTKYGRYVKYTVGEKA